MAITFHRLNAYPAGYVTTYPVGSAFDFINNPAANGDPGIPALFDGKIAGGPNQGTYFVGFGEDGLSASVNRLAEALTTNTDNLDNLLRRPIATPKETILVTAVGAVASVVLPDASGVYLGLPLMPIPDSLTRLFKVVDFQDNEIIDPVSGATVTVTSILGGALLSGFSVGPITVNVTPSIPNGVTYRVRYGAKSSEATLAENALLFAVIGSNQSDGVIQNLFRVLRSPPAINEPWDQVPFDSTIYDLTLSGLNERYNRSTAHDLTASIPTGSGLPTPIDLTATFKPGSGSWYKRSGPAMSGWTQRALHDVLIFGTDILYLDPIDALWTARIEDTYDTAVGTDNGRGGSSAFVTYGARRFNKLGLGTNAGYQPGLSKFLGLSQRTDSTTTIDPTNLTSLSPGNVGTFDTVSVPGQVLLVINGPDYFWTLVGPLKTSAIVCGYDMLEVEHTDTHGVTARRTYVIKSLDTVTTFKCQLVRTDGGLPQVANGSAFTFRRWLSLEFLVGDGVDEYRQALGLTNGALPRGLVYAQPPAVSTTGANNVQTSPAAFYAKDQLFGSTALRWGGFNPDASISTYQSTGFLFADGSIFAPTGALGMDSASLNTTVTAGTDITSTAGNIAAPLGLVSGLDMQATGPNAAFNGIISGKQISQFIKTANNAFLIDIRDVRDGYTRFWGTTYAGPAVVAFGQFNFVSTNALTDGEIKFWLYRANPATTLAFWLPLMFSDNGVTPVATYIDLLDTFLTPTFGPGGAVDVFVGRQIGAAVYWQAVGHFPVPLGASHGSHHSEDLHLLPARQPLRPAGVGVWNGAVLWCERVPARRQRHRFLAGVEPPAGWPYVDTGRDALPRQHLLPTTERGTHHRYRTGAAEPGHRDRRGRHRGLEPHSLSEYRSRRYGIHQVGGRHRSHQHRGPLFLLHVHRSDRGPHRGNNRPQLVQLSGSCDGGDGLRRLRRQRRAHQRGVRRRTCIARRYVGGHQRVHQPGCDGHHECAGASRHHVERLASDGSGTHHRRCLEHLGAARFGGWTAERSDGQASFHEQRRQWRVRRWRQRRQLRDERAVAGWADDRSVVRYRRRQQEGVAQRSCGWCQR